MRINLLWFVWILLVVAPCLAAEPEVITVSVPGPRNISYLPIDLISLIGADKAEGVRLRVQHTSGGGVALGKIAERDVDFAVAGLPAQMSMRAGGGDVITIAAVDDLTLIILMVRSELKGKVTRLADQRPDDRCQFQLTFKQDSFATTDRTVVEKQRRATVRGQDTPSRPELDGTIVDHPDRPGRCAHG